MSKSRRSPVQPLERSNDEINKIVDRIVFRTERFARKNDISGINIDSPTASPVPLSIKGEIIKETLQTALSETGEEFLIEAMAKVCSTLLDEKIILENFEPDSDETIEFKFGIAVVPIINDNAHNYTLNKPVILYDSEQGYSKKHSSSVGNCLSGVLNTFRLATREEIEELVCYLLGVGEPEVVEFLEEI